MPRQPRIGRQAPLGQSPQRQHGAAHRPGESSLGGRSHQAGTWGPAQYRRFGAAGSAKRNENKATFALAHTLIVIIWHILATGRPYDELGAGLLHHAAWTPNAKPAA